MSKDKVYTSFSDERFLGSSIGRLVDFLAITSCMGEEYRVLVAKIEVFELLIKFQEENEDFDLSKFIENVVKPALIKLGYAKWKRDILTDLALRSSQIRREKISFKEIFKEKE